MQQVLTAVQFYALLSSKRAKGMYTEEIAERLEVDPRSVRRWVAFLNEYADMEIPNAPFRLPRLQLTTHEGRSWIALVPDTIDANMYQTAAAHYAAQHLGAMDEDVMGLSAGNVLDMIGPKDEAKRREILERVRRSFAYRPFGPKLYHDSKWLDLVVQCIVARNPVTLRYLASGAEEETEHRVEPFTLVLYREAFYLLARQGWGGMTLFAIDRIVTMARHRDETFNIPDTFDPEEYFQGHFGVWKTRKRKQTIRIAFEPMAARSAAERHWPGTVDWTDAKDGRRTLTLEVPITPELEGWVMSWGPSAEVLEPDTLRKEIAKKVHAMAEAYAQ